MSMEDILKALMQSTAAQQQQSSGSGDAMAQMLGSMLGGGQQTGSARPQPSGDAMSEMLGGLLGGQTEGGGGSDLVTQAIGGLLGSQQNTGSSGVGSLLGGLQQILGGTPGVGAQLPLGGNTSSAGSAGPIMVLLQPLVNNLAAKLGVSPQIATVVASIALHYLLQSSPKTPGASPLNLNSVLPDLAAGKTLSPTTLQQSGMVNDVMQATGMDEKQAVRSLNTTLGVLGSSLTRVKTVQGGRVKKSTRGVKGKATVKRKSK
jgi:hypothetical protein